MKKVMVSLAVSAAVLAFPTFASAALLSFEGVAPSGSVVNVGPVTPYLEAGFTLTPTDNNSAVFDSAASVDFSGDTTDFFGFAEDNVITLTGPSAFNLGSLWLGPSTISAGSASITIVGTLLGGGTLTQTFSGLTAATLESLNWSNLSSVQFRTTDDSALDDISVTVPEPSLLVLLMTGGMAFIAWRRRTQHAS